jgi:hypothetical protein
MYKFIILGIKINKIIFFVFFKFRPNLHGFNKLVIKPIMHVKYKN